SVWRRPSDKLRIRTCCERLGGARTIGRLPPQVIGTAPIRRKDDPPAVPRPLGRSIQGRINRQPRKRRTLEVPDPAVVVLVADVEGETHTVGREPRIDVRTWWRGDRLFIPRPIDPDESPLRVWPTIAGRIQVHEGAGSCDGEVGSALTIDEESRHDERVSPS